MSHLASPLSIVLLASIADFPIYALVAPSGDTIILSQDSRVSTLINTPEIIQNELNQYDQFIVENEDEFILFHDVLADLTDDDISPKQQVDLIDNSLIILRSILQFKTFPGFEHIFYNPHLKKIQNIQQTDSSSSPVLI